MIIRRVNSNQIHIIRVNPKTTYLLNKLFTSIQKVCLLWVILTNCINLCQLDRLKVQEWREIRAYVAWARATILGQILA